MKFILPLLLVFAVVGQAVAHGDHLHDHDHDHQHDHAVLRSYTAIHRNKTVNVDASIYHDKAKLVKSRTRCGTHDPTEEEAAQIDVHIATKLQEKGMNHLLDTAPATHETAIRIEETRKNNKIPVYWHVIMNDEGTLGMVTNEQIKDSIKVLNKGFTRKFNTFQLMDVTYTRNSEWFYMTADDTDEAEAKAALHRGGGETLNIYSCAPDFFDDGTFYPLLGFATFPWWYNDDPLLDGVVILYDSVPGGGNPYGYDLGATLTHEVGHWVGLLHVFQGSTCDSNGDFIADTPYQSTPTSGCPNSKDSCPNKKGLDSVHNFMDYSDDICLETFTAKQKKRMLQAYIGYRAYAPPPLL